MPLVRENGKMLQRTLLYTAMSRASQLLVLVADPVILKACVTNSDSASRLTHLPHRTRRGVSLRSNTTASP